MKEKFTKECTWDRGRFGRMSIWVWMQKGLESVGVRWLVIHEKENNELWDRLYPRLVHQRQPVPVNHKIKQSTFFLKKQRDESEDNIRMILSKDLNNFCFQWWSWFLQAERRAIVLRNPQHDESQEKNSS